MKLIKKLCQPENQRAENRVQICDHTKHRFGNYKEIDSLAYYKSGQEVCGTKCGAASCDKNVYKKGKYTNDD